MINFSNFSRVRNYYIVCGYTDMRKQIDGLVRLYSFSSVMNWMKNPYSFSVASVQTGYKPSIGMEPVIFFFINVFGKSDFNGPAMNMI